MIKHVFATGLSLSWLLAWPTGARSEPTRPAFADGHPSATGTKPSTSAAQLSATDALAKARELMAAGRVSNAIAILKAAIREDPTSQALRWQLVAGYLADKNESWALRTLSALAELVPEDCEPLLWMAWIHLGQGAVDVAREELLSASCAPNSPSSSRREMLLAMLENAVGNRENARLHLEQARGAPAAYPEDRAAIDRLSGMIDPRYLPPVSVKLDFAAGVATNARAGSPIDPAMASADAASSVGQLSLWTRFVPPVSWTLRPTLELESRALGYGARAGSDFTYLTLGARPAVLIGETSPALLGYRIESLLLAGGDRYDSGPRWFYQAHRGELEMSPLSSLSLFAGVGRRLFRESGRSRTEADGGVGTSLSAFGRLRVLGALTGRWHSAEKSAYDLAGGSVLTSAELRLPAEWALRAGVMMLYDVYHHSAGYFDPLLPDTARRDVLVRLSASAFAPPVFGARAGITYEYSNRTSSAASYEYRDHRVLFKIGWSLQANPWAPTAVTSPMVPTMGHRLSSADFEDRIQDLLRKDEATQRSSSCLK